LLADILARIQKSTDTAVWIHLLSAEEVDAQALALEQRQKAGDSLPLYGVPFAVKDNIDVAGLPTTAGCPAYRHKASASASVVTRLIDAGAILIGKTNLDQFATGLAGDRSPYGVCRNPFDPTRVPGGSSSGSAVAVATGLVSFALGTDTAGSGRVPAGSNNIVGLKPTPGLLSTDGVVPACRSLDCVSVFALTVEDARLVCEIARGGSLLGHCGNESAEGPTFAVPREADLEFFGDAEQARLFGRAVNELTALGWRRTSVDFAPLREVGALLYDGPWLAERGALLADFFGTHAADLHPVIHSLWEDSHRVSGADVFRGLYRLEGLRPACEAIFEKAEVLVVPTFPTLPTLAEAQAASRDWARRLGTYTNFVNLLRWAAVAVPAGFTSRGLPGGITLIGPGGSDSRLCELALAWQRSNSWPLGATGRTLPKASLSDNATSPAVRRPAEGCVRVAVAGAHLRGQPLHPALLRFGARFVRNARTASCYRFIALMDLDPPRPGLLRDDGRAGSVQVEIYDLPVAGFGGLVQSVAPPLAIGTVELADGEAVKGFLCESHAAVRGRDITEFGGWLAFREHLARTGPRSARTTPNPTTP
jgi:allophanate hydrolase